MVPFYMSMAVIGFTRATCLNWVSEKETRQKELQKIMGVSSLGYILGWMLYFILNALLICTFMLLIIRFGAIGSSPEFVYKEGFGFFNIVIIYLLFTFSILGFVLILSNFFNRAKSAAPAIIFIQLILNFLYFFRFADFYRKSPFLIILSGVVSPQISFTFGISYFCFNKDMPEIDFSYSTAIIILGSTSIFYPLLAFYLEQVFPNELGVKKHPLFFIKWLLQPAGNHRR